MNRFVEKYWAWLLLSALMAGLVIHDADAATLTVEPSTVANPGDKTLVSWADAAGCVIDYKTADGAVGSWGSVPASGAENAWMQSSTTFTLVCNGAKVVSQGVVVGGVPAPSEVPTTPPPVAEPPPPPDEPEVFVWRGLELRTLWRKMKTPPHRFYFGFRHPETLMTYTFFMDTDKDDEAAIRSWGSYALRTSTWPYPKGITIIDAWEAVSLCDKWYLWADNDAAAPKMTRSAKLKQAGC